MTITTTRRICLARPSSGNRLIEIQNKNNDEKRDRTLTSIEVPPTFIKGYGAATAGAASRFRRVNAQASRKFPLRKPRLSAAGWQFTPQRP